MSIQLSINNLDVNIKPVEIPILGTRSADIFGMVLNNTKMVPTKELTSLKGRALRLEKLIPDLEAATESSKKDKIIALVALAVSVALVATGIALIAAGTGGIAPLIGAGLLAVYLNIWAFQGLLSNSSIPAVGVVA